MHNWETMSQSIGFEQSWSNMANAIIKSEPQSELTFNNNNTMMCNGDSSPTSPHSIESDESLRPNIYYNDAIHNALLMNSNHLHRPLGFNPLTPPGYPNACLLRTMSEHTTNGQEIALPTTPTRHFSKTENSFNAAPLTPSHTPPMDETPPKSPKFSPCNVFDKDCNELETSSMSGDDSKSLYSDYNQEITVPKVNSHGKVKTHKCKNCDYVAVTKADFWEHTKQHIKPEKRIQCKKCPFVTEYKHHYEYHLRNHEGSKPFKCPECNYTCVNKSMLNSHLKSHSDIYQYRCENCSYATKYVHSLKLHLRKYQHEPALPLDCNGEPDTAPVIDVYGTRRGPKKRSSKAAAKKAAKAHAKLQKVAKESKQNGTLNQIQTPQQIPKLTQQQQQPVQQPAQQHLQQQPTPPFQNLLSMLPMGYLQNFNYMQMFAAQQQVLSQLSPNNFRNGCDDDISPVDEDDVDMPLNGNRTDLDLSHAEEPSSSVPNHHVTSQQLNNNRRCSDDEHSIHLQQNKITIDQPTKIAIATSHSYRETEKLCRENIQENNDDNQIKSHHCKYCGITYMNAVLHTIHMGFHCNNEVFTCNRCGEKCADPISFNMHINMAPHP